MRCRVPRVGVRNLCEYEPAQRGLALGFFRSPSRDRRRQLPGCARPWQRPRFLFFIGNAITSTPGVPRLAATKSDPEAVDAIDVKPASVMGLKPNAHS